MTRMVKKYEVDKWTRIIVEEDIRRDETLISHKFFFKMPTLGRRVNCQ